MVSTRSKTGATPARSPLKTITKRRHSKSASSPRLARGAPTPFPDLSLHSDSGSVVSTHSLLSDAAPGLILFTYPRANTGGCTTQAKGLSALREPALAAGYNIVGCSYDSVKSQASWKLKSSIPLMLLSDTPSVGLLRHLSVHKPPRGVKRSVFVITRQGDSLQIVLAKRAVSPKDCISLIEEYIKDNPLKPASAGAGADHAMMDDTPQAESKPPASKPAVSDMTDVAEKPKEEATAEKAATDQPMDANPTANHTNAEPPATKADPPLEPTPKESGSAMAGETASEQANHKPADAPQPQPDATANKSATAEQTQATTDKKPEASPSWKNQKESTETKPNEKHEENPEEKPEANGKDKPVVMDVEKPQNESKV